MNAWIEGLKAGVQQGHFRRGHDQGNNYALGSDERSDWHNGFVKGCQLHQDLNHDRVRYRE